MAASCGSLPKAIYFQNKVKRAQEPHDLKSWREDRRNSTGFALELKVTNS